MGELSISIMVADRSYKLVIEKDYEELFRQASKLIESRIKTYSNNYAYKDKQDLLAMVAIDNMINLLQSERKNSETESFLDKKLTELDAALTKSLVEQSV